MCRILEYKTREQKFIDWLNEVFKRNKLPQQKNIKNALMLWEVKKNKHDSTIMHARFNCDIEELERYRDALNELIFQRKMRKFLAENIADFIEYIE